MTINYICSPYRAKTPQQHQIHLEYAKELSKRITLSLGAVITPHLYYPLFLDDNVEREREIGMESALDLLKVCDTLVVGQKHGISSGMQMEIDFAKKNNIDIIYTN